MALGLLAFIEQVRRVVRQGEPGSPVGRLAAWWVGLVFVFAWQIGAAAEPESYVSLTAGQRPLTTAAAILALSPEQANKRLPVRLRGITTLYQHPLMLFVQDETAGIFVYHTGEPLPLRAGQHVEVTGVTAQGRYSPIIDLPSISVLPSGPAVRPKTVSLSAIHQGGIDAQWVETTGVIRETARMENALRVVLCDPPLRITLWIPGYTGSDLVGSVGSIASVRGVVVSSVDGAGAPESLQIFSSAPEDLAIVRPGPADPWSHPVTKIPDLKKHQVRHKSLGGVRIQGVVTLCWPGRVIFVQDPTGAAVEVHSRASDKDVAPGAVVDVFGFMGALLGEGRLEDAVIRELGAGESPSATRVSAVDLPKPRHQSQLVETDGQLLGLLETSTNMMLAIVNERRHFISALLPSRGAGDVAYIEPGSRLRIRGVYRQTDSRWGTATTSLLLRSRSDIQVLSRPQPTSQPGQRVVVAAVLFLCLGGALAGWIVLKQRRETSRMLQAHAALQAEMRERDEQLRRSIEDRERIGRDLHDDIIQSIYAAGLNLEDCKRVVAHSPSQAQARLQAATQTLNDAISSVRRFIAGLEPAVLNGREFKTALKSLALTSGDNRAEYTFEVDMPAANALTSTQATQLLHIAKEGISNALRHAQGSALIISLRQQEGNLRLEIADDGTGFDPAAGNSSAGQGLRNMAGRAVELGGHLEIVSAPGEGCRILVTIPQRN